MSKKIKIKNLEKEIMDKVVSGEIAIKPKWHFVLGSILTILGFSASIIASVFVFNLISFLFRIHGPMGKYRLQEILNSFPIWIPLAAILGLAAGFYFLKKFDFSYKKNIIVIAAGLLISMFLAGVLMDLLRLNDVWAKKGYMQRFYRQFERPGWQLPTERPRNFPRGRYFY